MWYLSANWFTAMSWPLERCVIAAMLGDYSHIPDDQLLLVVVGRGVRLAWVGLDILITPAPVRPQNSSGTIL